MKKLKAIVAVNNHFHIGKEGGMLWHSTPDLQHFKKLTEGCKCVVGNTTAKGLPPLKNRELLIVSRSGEPGTMTLEEALAQEPDWIIGGDIIYRQTLYLCDELHLSHINDNSIGDTLFNVPVSFSGEVFHYWFQPNYKAGQEWKMV